MRWRSVGIGSIVGESIASITGADDGDVNMVLIRTSSGREFRMSHRQNCCEDVDVVHESCEPNLIIGDIITDAKVSASELPPEDCEELPELKDDSHTWTLFEFGTRYTTYKILWLGESNGYYDEGVTFEENIP